MPFKKLQLDTLVPDEFDIELAMTDRKLVAPRLIEEKKEVSFLKKSLT